MTQPAVAQAFSVYVIAQGVWVKTTHFLDLWNR